MRQLDPAFLAALERPLIRPVIFVYLDWPGEAVRAHSWTGVLSWGGEDWRGVGAFGAISPASEGRSSAAKRLTLSLMGLPEQVTEDLGVPIRNRPARIYMGLLDAGGALAGTPDLMTAGVMDARRFRISGGKDGRVEYGLSIDVWTGASPRRPGASLHSFDDQLSEQPGDTAGRHTVLQPEKVVLWPE